MNGELPPVDPGIREQLARRSAGRLPEGLLSDVSAAVDGVSVERPARLRLGFAAMGAPRLAAAASLALVFVVAAALVAVPRFMTSPAGNTSYAALTAPELASLLAAKTPPAMNTTLVATVTVDSRNDVCPMNRYPTRGVIEGMGSQVCVMGADLTAYLSADRVSAPKVTGTFAFRYLAPGYLGLIGELTLPVTGVTFRATDDWPLQGRTFLVDGWRGADELTGSCIAPTAGDVLLPDGGDCPYDNWLGTDSTAPGIAADHVTVANSPEPTYDPLSLRGDARHVEAGGMRIIDSIDHAAPMHGVYVVRPVTEGCPNASPIDSRGCGYWRVLARVSDTSLHAPTATATPTQAPTGVYPTDRALTTDELARLLAEPGLAVNTALVASVTIDPQPDACPMNSRPTYGVIHGIDPQVCVIGPVGDTSSVAAGRNVFAFRYIAPGYLGLLGLIQPASASKLAHRVVDDWSQAGKVLIVQGWLGADPIPCPSLDPAQSVDPLNPVGVCGQDWMSDEDPNTPPNASGSLTVPKRLVLAGGMRLIDELPGEPAVHGAYVVRNGAPGTCSTASTNSGNCGVVLAKLADVTIPKVAPSASPTPSPTATPTVAPPATPLIPAGGSPIGLFGYGNRPLTADEFASVWAADPARLAGRIVVAKGPVPTRFQCADAIWEGKPADAPCVNLSIQGGYIAQEGYWVIRVGADGKLSIVGEISIPDTSFVYSFRDAVDSGMYSGKPVMVDAWFDWRPCDSPPYPSDNACYGGEPTTYLAEAANLEPIGNRGPASIPVQLGAYNKFGSTDLTTGPIHGVFLIQYAHGSVEVLARLEVADPIPWTHGPAQGS